MNDSFFFALLRISIAHILKATGFDKCRPSILNVVVDLYIHYLREVVSKAQRYAVARTHCTNVMEAQDVLQAILETQLIKPLTGESVLDPHDLPEAPSVEYNTQSLESFLRWLRYSDQYRLSRRLSAVPNSMIRTLMEKRKIDTSDETDQEKKKRRLKERQEYYNHLKQNTDGSANPATGIQPEDLDEDEVTANDKLLWLAYMAEKDTKLGHNLQYANTALQDTVLPVHRNHKFHPPTKDRPDNYAAFLHQINSSTKNDHLVLSANDYDIPDDLHTVPSDHLKPFLPYNVSYPPALLSDDLDQYADYVTKHGYPVDLIRHQNGDKLEGVNGKESLNDVNGLNDGESHGKEVNEGEVEKEGADEGNNDQASNEKSPEQSNEHELGPSEANVKVEVKDPNMNGDSKDESSKDSEVENAENLDIKNPLTQAYDKDTTKASDDKDNDTKDSDDKDNDTKDSENKDTETQASDHKDIETQASEDQVSHDKEKQEAKTDEDAEKDKNAENTTTSKAQSDSPKDFEELNDSEQPPTESTDLAMNPIKTLAGPNTNEAKENEENPENPDNDNPENPDNDPENPENSENSENKNQEKDNELTKDIKS